MATFRVGVGSFNINDSAVGIGTETSGNGKLKVEGITRASTVDIVGGASTFTRYSGFSANQISVNDRNFLSVHESFDRTNRILELTGEVQTTGDVIVDDNTSLKVGLGSTACFGSLEYACVKHHFSTPVGDTNQRNSSVYVEGTIRYNTDLGTMEFFNGNEWRQFTYMQDTHNSPSSRGRAVFGGGNSPSKESEIDFVNISSLGDAKDFGDMSTGMNQAAGSASETRGLMSGGYDGSSRSDNNDYITIASEGNAIDFGNLSAGRSHPGACNSSTRSLVIAGYTGSRVNTIDYVEISTVGNSIDFGDSISSRDELCALSSPTRGLSAAGGLSGGKEKIIDFVTIASKGNAVKFGDLTVASAYACGGGNGIRGIIMPGNTPSPSGTDPTSIDQITIASEGNAVDFGGAANTIGTQRGGSGCSKTRMVFGSGSNPSVNNTLEFIIINSNGNAEDFGDLTLARSSPAGLSDSNGGLGGY